MPLKVTNTQNKKYIYWYGKTLSLYPLWKSHIYIVYGIKNIFANENKIIASILYATTITNTHYS